MKRSDCWLKIYFDKKPNGAHDETCFPAGEPTVTDVKMWRQEHANAERAT